MSTRVLVIGLDAAEATLIERWALAGDLPTFDRLSRCGRVMRLDDNPLEALPEAIWHELHTGIHAHELGRYYVPQQIHTGESRARPIVAGEIDSSQFYWSIASAAGRRAAVIDPVHAVRVPNFNGVQLFEFGLHDRHFAVASDPPELLRELRSRYGDYPVGSCDDHGATKEGYRALCANLERGVALKEQIVCDLLRQGSWDLLCATFAESHCVGHQFWHFQDPCHPRHDPDAPEDLRLAMNRVYRCLDAAVGRLIEQAGPDALVLVVASHGMGLYVGGYQLLPELLLRMGLSTTRAAASRAARRAVRFTYHWLRGRVGLFGHRRPFTGALVGGPVRDFFGTPVDGLQSSTAKAVTVLNNRVGAIRLNLRGREPRGCVEPGAEADAVLAAIREELERLEHRPSGERMVKRVVTAQEIFGRDRHPDVPDLMVVFRTDLGQLEACWSPRFGLIKRPLFTPKKPRTGDHTTESRLWLSGPGASVGEGRASSRDLAPTVLAALRVPVPPAMAGQSLLG
jgi:predicted AlkP superfamily phosphohydrolase/phosphomutase